MDDGLEPLREAFFGGKINSVQFERGMRMQKLPPDLTTISKKPYKLTRAQRRDVRRGERIRPIGTRELPTSRTT